MKIIKIKDNVLNRYDKLRCVIKEPLSADIQIRVFVFGRYEIYVNGVCLGAGPARYTQKHREYDEYSIKIEAEPVCISILAHYPGRDHFSYIAERAGVLVSLETEGRTLLPCWKMIKAEEYMPAYKQDIQLGFTQFYATQKETPGWMQVDFDDSKWNTAVLEDFCEKLYPRSIPQMQVYENCCPKRSWVGEYTPIDCYYTEFACVLDFHQEPVAEYGTKFYTYLYANREKTVRFFHLKSQQITYYINNQEVVGDTITLKKGCNRLHGTLDFMEQWQISFGFYREDHVRVTDGEGHEDRSVYAMKIGNKDTAYEAYRLIENVAQKVQWEQPHLLRENAAGAEPVQCYDFDRIFLGKVSIEVEAKTDAILNVVYCEGVEEAILQPAKGNVWCGDRFYLTKGIHRLSTFDVRAFRYIGLITDGDIQIHKIYANQISYPIQEHVHLNSHDLLLNQIWSSCKNTLMSCMEDAYIDCPWRERAQWWADARVMFAQNRVIFGDTKLMRRGLYQIAEGINEEKLLPCVYPNRFEGTRLRDFGCHWILSLHEYAAYSGESQILSDLLPVARLVLKDYLQHREDGLYTAAESDLLIDWGNHGKYGKKIAMNALLYQAITAMEEMDSESDYTLYKQQISEHLARFWNGEYYGDVNPAENRNASSIVASNTLMILSGIAPKEHYPSMVKRIKEQLDYSLTHPQDIKVTGYFLYYVLQALDLAGESEYALGFLKEWWRFYIDSGHNNVWHGRGTGGSLCHGWATAPIAYLAKHCSESLERVSYYSGIGLKEVQEL